MIRQPIIAGVSAGGAIIFVFAILILIVVGIVLICKYFLQKTTIFKIDYAGGNIGFDMRFITSDEAVKFQKDLRTCKDNVEINKLNQTEQIRNYNNNSVPDELRQYNELLTQGVISQEDFEAKKKQLLNL